MQIRNICLHETRNSVLRKSHETAWDSVIWANAQIRLIGSLVVLRKIS
jgi:hypothetical protein